jgi:hypothetical protein
MRRRRIETGDQPGGQAAQGRNEGKQEGFTQKYRRVYEQQPVRRIQQPLKQHGTRSATDPDQNGQTDQQGLFTEVQPEEKPNDPVTEAVCRVGGSQYGWRGINMHR